MREELLNNQVVIEGEIVSEFVYDHEVKGERFYEVYVSIPRLNSENKDIIPCIVSERIIDVKRDYTGVPIMVYGQFRSHNRDHKLLLRLFVLDFDWLPELTIHKNMSRIVLRGYVCKPPVYRVTPKGREITDVMLAVNRPYGKSDYIPCVCWGRNAVFSSGFVVGDPVEIEGRIQSREYKKWFADDTYETRITYEVSATTVQYAQI